MILKERSFSGQVFRPKPLVDANSIPNTVIIATSWGHSENANTIVQRVKEFLSLASEPDATAMGSFIEGIGTAANRLRSAALFANESLFTKENQTEYVAGVELAVLTTHNNNISWVQVGMPHILLASRKGLEPLCYTPDWSWQMGSQSPLLSHGLGLEKHCQVQCGSIRTESLDKVVLLCRSSIPGFFYSQSAPDISNLSQVLVDDDQDMPFWLGILEI